MPRAMLTDVKRTRHSSLKGLAPTFRRIESDIRRRKGYGSWLAGGQLFKGANPKSSLCHQLYHRPTTHR